MRFVLSLICLLGVACRVSPLPNGEPKQVQKKLICYYTNWSAYRTIPASFLPSDLDPTLCTHIVYSFALLDPESLEMVESDPWLDIDSGFFEQVTALKAQGPKVIIAIGGWTDSADDKYSRMVNNVASRANFVAKAVEFIEMHNFDGLDLDWEYPVCWQGNCTAGPPSDRANFVNLVKELKAEFTPRNWTLSSAVSAGRATGDIAYDVVALSEELDWIGMMNYDYAGGWDGRTGMNSPFGGPPPSTVDTVNYFLERGAAPEKLIAGVPLYGRSFTLTSNETGVGAPAESGAPGEFTGEAGFLAFFEICRTFSPVIDVPNVGAYAVNGDQWVSFDNTGIIAAKTEYIRAEGLGGAMVWAIDLDDFSGVFCGSGRYPLMNALKSGLAN